MIKAPVTQGLAHLRHFGIEVRFAELPEHRLVLIQRTAVGHFFVMHVVQENRLILTLHQL